MKVEGKIIAARTAEMAVQGIKLAREKQCHKFLIDYTLAEVGDSTLDTYTFMTNLESLGITPVDQIAIVYARDKVQHVFAETVAANRGWDNIRYFFEMSQAQEWLISLRKLESAMLFIRYETDVAIVERGRRSSSSNRSALRVWQIIGFASMPRLSFLQPDRS